MQPARAAPCPAGGAWPDEGALALATARPVAFVAGATGAGAAACASTLAARRDSTLAASFATERE